MNKFIFAVVLTMFGINSARAADATVSWTHPTQYTDGTAFTVDKIKESLVQYGTCTTATTPTFGTLTADAVVPAPAATVKLTGITAGTYCFRVRTVDTNSQVSSWSIVVQKAVVEVKPKAPTTVIVTSP